MKKFVLCMLLVFGAAALTLAQGWGGKRDFGSGAQPPVAEKATVSGALTIVQGSLAVKSGDTTYFTPGLWRYVGFIDSLKDGAQVQLEGAALTGPQDANSKTLWVTKLTVGGKDYDLSRPQPSAQGAPAWPMPQMQQRNRGR